MSQTLAVRQATRRHYLMCRPTYFDVTYAINPWMDPGKPVDTGLAIAQWEGLRRLYQDHGHTVDLIEPVEGLPDMVFAANGATVVDDRVLVARFRHPQRAAEAPAYREWFTAGGYREVHLATNVNEAEGDYMVVGATILAGTGFRTDPRAHAELQAALGRPVVTLTLTDPRFYHLDTALAVLSDTEVMYYPGAFCPDSLATLRALFPDAVVVEEADAVAFGLNAVSDGLHVFLPDTATGLAGQLRERGFEPVGVDLSELLKAGGSVKCCTLEIRHQAQA
ncbi:dimethylargininase [Streptomyces resistomycificus]|uniref:Amidinotransferase n=1 Tax=Streptomyces resistomycificus TaxID=67356 RepID=A0A0L8L3G5_9ACTN|nr:dimethylargininase [Streptomyces resistomycificus]KOG32621.1 amidinotransferase [Streptomyces resistomycificus]KUN90560.1 amidinotransferase [Streptomyces resistomycificus]